MSIVVRQGLLLGGIASVVLSCSWTLAQGPTTIQLPTFDSFSVSTTVSVPDRGSLLLGGVNRAASGSISSGVPGLGHLPLAGRLFHNRAVGHEASAATASVSASIHDLSAMDEQLLAEAAASRASSSDASAPSWEAKAARLTRALESSRSQTAAHSRPTARPGDVTSGSPPVSSVSAIRRQVAADAELRESEARDLISQGLAAEQQGKPQVAKIFYQMATRRSAAESRRAAQSHLARLAASVPARPAPSTARTP